VRLTETFRAGFAPEGTLHLSIWDFLSDSDQRSQLGRVLEGRLLRAELALPSAMGSVAAEAEAVLDAAVTRHALLTIAPAAPDCAPRSGSDTLLADPSLDLSPAIVWIKDLSGRYLKINRRYTECLRVEAASIQGKTDAELSPAQIVDGPRLLSPRGNGSEPVQLEYTAAPVEGREALTVLRFPLHGLDGTPVAICGVAAPIADAATARAEAERLLRIERWAGLSVAAIRAELIQEWQLAEVEPAEPAADPPAAASPPAAGSAAASAAATAELQRLQTEIDATRATMAELESLLAETRAGNAELESRRAEEQARSAQLEQALEKALEEAARAPEEIVSPAQVAELEAALAEARARAEAAEAEAEGARALGGAGEELAAERARADRAEGQVAAAQARAEQAEREAVAARARIQGAEREIAAARARVAELKSAQTTSRAAEDNAAELRARADLERRLAEAHRRAEQAERGLAAERADAVRARGELAARAEEAERSLAGARAEADAAQRAAAARADAAEQSLAVERGELLARAERAEQSLAAERGGAGRAHADLAARAEQAERALAAERAEAERARGELAAQVEDAERDLASERGELIARAEQAERALAAERAEAGQTRGDLAARAEDAERALAAERAEAGQASAGLIARAERAEATIADVRASGERASVAAERAEAAAGLARGRADGLEVTVAIVRKAEAETRAALEQARAEVGSLQRALAQARAETAAAQEVARQAARQAAERVERERREFAARPPVVAEAPAPSVAPAPSGPSWSHSAQRALTTSIADASEWRNGLKDALRTVGIEGGWEVVVAWCPDERGNAFRCMAMWMAAPGEHALFETSTWQRRLSPAASRVGRAATGDRANWVNDLTSADDVQLAAAAGEGMRGALLVPLRRAGETSGVLELLTSTAGGLGPEVAPAMEAVGLQLAHFEYLLRRGAEPRWRMGRL
jgi:hypothetical protein